MSLVFKIYACPSIRSISSHLVIVSLTNFLSPAMQGEMLSSAVMKELTRGAVVIQKSILIQTIFINFLGLVSSTVGS